MKRLLLALLGAAFFALVGIEASHSHPRSVSPDCHFCALGAQTIRHAAADAPTLSKIAGWTFVPETTGARATQPRAGRASARAPPAA